MKFSGARPATASQEAERLSRVIFHYAARIGSEADPDKLLQLNADMARDLVQADRCSIWLRDSSSGELWTKIAHGLPEIRIAEWHGLVGACIAANEAIVVNDTSKDSRFNEGVDRSSGYVTQSVLILPLRSHEGDVIGALQVLNKPGGFQDSDVKLLAFAASFSASALVAQKLRQEAEAARLLFHELEIARDVQQRLFPPHPPLIRGLDIAAYCRPANLVGGDYYDFLYRPDSELWFTVGDVSGKGVSAAVLMASLQASLRTQLNGRPSSAADIVSDLNQAVCSLLGQERYSTLFCARLNPFNWTLTYVNAGHIYPRLLRSTGTLDLLDRGGFPVGLIDSADYEQADIRLESGDLLACFSDGITEARNSRGEMWEEDDIDKILRDNRHKNSTEILGKLIEAADDYMGAAEQADDITIVLLRVL